MESAAMFTWLSYYLDRIRYPHVVDFISMGLGIEARYRRCARAWEPHLRLTQEFLEAAASDLCPAARIAILGAGRLLDVPIDKLMGMAKEIHLFDADPGCLRRWRALPPERALVVPHIMDLTGTLARWTESLRSDVRMSAITADAVAESLENLAVDKPPSLESYDLVISLNLLSQIPIYWRDRVESIVGPRLTDNPRVATALERTYGQLQTAQLKLLSNSNARRIVLVTDERFFYYRNDIAPWQEEQSLYLDSLLLAGYAVSSSDSWYWHIIPQGIEEADFGSIHAVKALEFRRTPERSG